MCYKVDTISRAGFGFDEAAEAAIKETRFEPALMGDQPVVVLLSIPIRFKLK